VKRVNREESGGPSAALGVNEDGVEGIKDRVVQK